MTAADDLLAHELAAEAGERLLKLRAGGGDATALRQAGDRQSHEFLTAELARLRPGDAVLSEEGRRRPRPAVRPPGLDRRPAGRHPRIR
jgi:3''-Phosphoadenosine 5''-phosphosulfate (PAPS) 3''-phosphatase